MIGRRCKGGDVLSRPVLIARYLFRVLSFLPSDLSQVTYCGGYGGGDPPLPIPNREVKPAGADGSAPPGVRVGSCRFSGVPETIRFVPGTPSFMPAGQRPHGTMRHSPRQVSARTASLGSAARLSWLPAQRLCPAQALSSRGWTCDCRRRVPPVRFRPGYCTGCGHRTSVQSSRR